MSNNALKHPAQRVGVFVDVQNLYYSAKALYGHKVNFGEILKEAVGERHLVRAVAYTIRAEMPEEQSFFDALENLGFEVKTKELQTFISGQKKGDWDVGIAVDILKMAPKLDAVVLCSGDGDYVDLLHHAKAEGCRVEVISFGRSTSQKLAEETDDFIDMDKDADRFTLRPRTNGKPAAPVATEKPERPERPVAPKKPATRAPQRPKKKESLEDAIIRAVDAQEQEAKPAQPQNTNPQPQRQKNRRFGLFN